MPKQSFKEQVIELMKDGERRTAGDIGTELGVLRHTVIENFLLNNQALFEFNGVGWKIVPIQKRTKVDPIMQVEFP